MRFLFLVLALLFASQPALSDKLADPKPDKPKSKDADAAPEFPIPKDATAPASAPGGGGKIKSYEVPRGRDVVLAEMREALKKGGWTISKEDTSPRGTIRLEIKHGDKTWRLSVLGDAAKTALVLTLP